MRRRTAVAGGLLAGLMACGLVVGCTSEGGVSATSAALPQAAVAPRGAPAVSGGSAAKEGAGSNGGAASDGGDAAGADSSVPAQGIAAAGRQVIRSASISLSVRDVTATAARVRAVAMSVGGYTGSENTGPDNANFTLQVPSARLDATVDQLAGLGRVLDRGAQAQDVTDQMVDVGSRLAAQQASVTRVRALLAKAASIADVVSIEGELTKREADLESLEQQRTELAAQVAMSTVTVGLARDVAVAPARSTSHGFLGGLAAGWHSFLDVLGGALVVIGAVLPYLLGVGVPVALVWWLVRRWRGARVRPAAAESPDAA
jgi:hypothetical protein